MDLANFNIPLNEINVPPAPNIPQLASDLIYSTRDLDLHGDIENDFDIEIDQLEAPEHPQAINILIMVKIILPYNALPNVRTVAFLTSANDIYRFINTYQIKFRNMVHQYGVAPFLHKSAFNKILSLRNISEDDAEALYQLIIGAEFAIINYNKFYQFQRLPDDLLSPLVELGGRIQTNIFTEAIFNFQNGILHVSSQPHAQPEILSISDFNIRRVDNLQLNEQAHIFNPYIFNIEFTQPIFSRDVALHHMTVLFNMLIGKPGPWFTPGNNSFTMERNYEAFIRIFIRAFRINIPVDNLILSRFSLRPFNDNPNRIFWGNLGNRQNNLRIFPLPELIWDILQLSRLYHDRLLDRDIIDFSSWTLEISPMHPNYQRVFGARRIPRFAQIGVLFENNNILFDTTKPIKMKKKPFIVIDPDEERFRTNKYCLVTSVWLGLDLARLKKPRNTWLETSRSWFNHLRKRNNIPNVFKNQKKFIEEKLFFNTLMKCFKTQQLKKKCFVIMDRNFKWLRCYYLNRTGKICEASHTKTKKFPGEMMNKTKIYILTIETHAFLALPRKQYPELRHLDNNTDVINPAIRFRWTHPAKKVENLQNFFVGDTESYSSPKDQSETVYMAQIANKTQTFIWCLKPPKERKIKPYEKICLEKLPQMSKNNEVIIEVVEDPIMSKIQHIINNGKLYHKSMLFYHNLAGFDFKLIYRKFIKSGFHFVGQPISGVYGGVARVNTYCYNIKIPVITKKRNRDGTPITRQEPLTIILSDSYSLFSQSLSSLSKALNVTHSKLDFDTLSVTHENYIEKMVEIIPYATNDVRGLYEIMDIMGKRLLTYGANYKVCPTSTSISNRTFLTSFYKPDEAPIYNLSYEDSRFISQAYHGGRTECFYLGILPVKKGKTQIESYDINSAYPDKMCDYLPIGAPTYEFLDSNTVHKNGEAEFIGEWRTKISGTREKYTLHEFNKKGRNVLYEDFENETFFGFIACRVVGGYSEKSPIPLLPYKYLGKNIYPIFRSPTQMVLSTAFLDEIWEKGLPYKITFLDKAIHFKKFKIFKDFVLEFYSKRQKAKETGQTVEDLLTKAILNQLYGRTAFERCRKYLEFIKTDKDLLEPEFQYDRGILMAIKMDEQILLQKYGFCDTKLAAPNIAAFITSKAQIHLHRAITKIKLSKDAIITYCDTDSIQTIVPINERTRKPPRFPISKKLGEWDFEGGPYHFGCVNQKKNYCLMSKDLYQNNSKIIDINKVRKAKLKHYGFNSVQTHTKIDKSNADELITKHEKPLKKIGFKGIKRSIVKMFQWSLWEKIARGDEIYVTQVNSFSGLQTYFSEPHLGKIYRSHVRKKVSRSIYRDGYTENWKNITKKYSGPLKPLVIPEFEDNNDRNKFLTFLKDKNWFYNVKT